jgi:ribosomal protein L33
MKTSSFTSIFAVRKSQLLAGSNIYITEDFSKRVKDRRMELQKFMKKLKKR